LPKRQSTAVIRRWCRSSRAILFGPFLLMAVAKLCSRRNRQFRPQSRCRSPRTARRQCLRDRTCPFRKLFLHSSIIFGPFLLMAVANLCSRRNRHLHSQYRCRSTRSARRQYLRDKTCRLTWTLLDRAVASHVQVVTRHNRQRSPSCGVGRSAISVSSGHRQSMTMASFTLLLLLALSLLLLLLPPSPSGARTHLLSSRLDAPTMAFFPLLLPTRLHALMMAFFPLLPSTSLSLPPIPSGAWALPPRVQVYLRGLLLHPFLVCHPRHLGRIPFPFLPSTLHIFLHLLLISLLSSRLFLFLLPSLPALLASLHSLLLHNRQVAQCSVTCPFLDDIACHYVSLCRSFISPSSSLHFPVPTGEST